MTDAETAFVNRMVPHIEAGKSFEEAARAVLADDERLWLIAVANDEQGELIRAELAATVYRSIRNRRGVHRTPSCG